jgi:hypothetical protein
MSLSGDHLFRAVLPTVYYLPASEMDRLEVLHRGKEGGKYDERLSQIILIPNLSVTQLLMLFI